MRLVRKLWFIWALALVACNREEPAPANTAPAAQPAAADIQPQVNEEPPAESGLAIKRGIAMLASDRTTFRPCGENAELWVVDQTDGILAQGFADEVRTEPALVYVEAYGERAPVDDVPAASSYAGLFLLEEVLYAGVEGQVSGCDAPPPAYIVAARGNEPFWAVEVHESQMIWRQPEAPKEIVFGAPQTEDSEGTVRYLASRDAHQVELVIAAQSCRDSMSGELFAHSARAVFDTKQFTGCARVGQ